MGRKRNALHQCQCEECRDGKKGSPTRRKHAAINRFLATLDERGRRIFAGFIQEIYGGVTYEYTAIITGLSRHTIKKGYEEWESPDLLTSGRTGIRRPGGGRKRVVTQEEAILEAMSDMYRSKRKKGQDTDR